MLENRIRPVVASAMPWTWTGQEPAAWASAAGCIALLARWWLLGWTWSWLLTDPRGATVGLWDRAARLALHAVLGLVLSTLLAGSLAAIGAWTPALDWLLAAALAVSGFLAARSRGIPLPAPRGPDLMCAAPVAVLLAILASVPGRGEWMVGGWDPGIYVQQAVALARAGSWRAPVDPFWAAIPQDEIAWFTRPSFNFIEAYPVVPLDPDRRSLEPFFFPFTPLVMAQIARASGLLAACRANELIGVLATLAFAAAAWRMTRSRVVAGAALLFLGLHPIWLYHFHFPTSEVVQVFVLAGIAWGMAAPVRDTRAIAGVSVFFLAATLNRLAFLPFGALLLAADAWFRPRARGRVAWTLAMAVGALVDFMAVPITIGRLGRSVTTLLLAAVCIIALAGFLAWLGRRAYRAEVLRTLRRWTVPAGAAAALALFGMFWFARDHVPPILSAGTWNARLMWAYGVPAVIVAAALGVMATPAFAQASRAWRVWLAFLIASTVLTSATPEIARIAPWAVRRQVEFLVPLLALGSAGLLGWILAGQGGAWPRRLVAGGTAVLLVAIQVPAARTAWSATEYNGLDATLRAIASRIEPGDIVVADHFKWATPLKRIYEREVLNGEVWCSPPRPDDLARAMIRLQYMASARGGRILVLTSTEKQLEVFPSGLPATRLLWTAPAWSYREVVHSARARVVEARAKEKVFRLHEVLP